MELVLEQGLSHQETAVERTVHALDGVRMTPPVRYYENPGIDLHDGQLTENIKNIQQTDIAPEYRGADPAADYLNLDIKMETGTGKTYVYTKTIYELHRRYSMNKFILIVPSLAIKAGAEQFLSEDYVRRHFADSCGYGAQIELQVLSAIKTKKKGRNFFPAAVSDFVKGSCQLRQKIYVLLMNMQLLTSGKMLTREDYDYGPEGFYSPLKALAATRPVVILDEPHRFSRQQKAFQAIAQGLRPQCVIRYGATFPEKAVGRGKQKQTVHDYQNLLYNLDACASFNQNLIKGVAKEHFEPASRREEKVKVMTIDSRTSVTFRYERQGEMPRSFTLQKGDAMAILSDNFQGITIYAVGKNTVEFSNGVVKSVGEVMDVDIYMQSYQESMIQLALDRHFSIERANFSGRKYKIKTLALFFIDDIASYRPEEGGKEAYLLQAFERLLKAKLEKLLTELDEHEGEYKAYLEASLADITACHAGYFSKDTNNPDDDIAREVDIILHGKKELLSFHKEDGKYNTLRFLFSKWTLKEGWDNPNVFTITKLRSSGSENSKLQEVGRGLRLPVDENGNRIANESFMLNYIVDFTEADFAQKLVEQINGDQPQVFVLSKDKLMEVAQKLDQSANELFKSLLLADYIDMDCNINAAKREQLFEEYPDFAAGVAAGKIKDRNQEKPKPVRIRKDVYQELQGLWQRINERYMLFYDTTLDDGMGAVVLSLWKTPGIFSDVMMTSQRQVLKADGAAMILSESTGEQYLVMRRLPYHEFLQRIQRATNLPIVLLHRTLCDYTKQHGVIPDSKFNASTVAAFCSAFFDWKNTSLMGHFRYQRAQTQSRETALTYADGSAKETIAQGRIGTKLVPGTPSEKYLYDMLVYDSPLEGKNIKTNVDEVVVYGKIPRNSIAIPSINGGTYSPDFMYVVKKSNGDKEVNIIVETKDVDKKTDLRGDEQAKIDCAKVFFEQLTMDGYTVKFRTQIRKDEIGAILKEVIEQERL